MNAEEYLKGLNEHDPVFEIDTEYEFTEQQLINFAERYHEKQLKLLRIGVVSNNEVALKAFVKEYIEAWEDGMDGDTDLYRKAKSLL